MTTFIIDASSAQQGMSIGACVKQGYPAFIVKCTEGQGYKNPEYEGMRNEAQQEKALFMAYHVVRSDSGVMRQAQNLASHIGDKSIPVAIDLEPFDQSRPRLAHALAFAAACAELGMHVSTLYFPQFWWRETGSPDIPQRFALWQALYGNNPSGYGSAIYPGDNSPRWSDQGRHLVNLLQFGSRAKIDGWNGNVDVSAFKGTREQLAQTGWFKDYSVEEPQKAPEPAADIAKHAISLHVMQASMNHADTQQQSVTEFDHIFSQHADIIGFTGVNAFADNLLTVGGQHGYDIFHPELGKDRTTVEAIAVKHGLHIIADGKRLRFVGARRRFALWVKIRWHDGSVITARVYPVRKSHSDFLQISAAWKIKE